MMHARAVAGFRKLLEKSGQEPSQLKTAEGCERRLKK
jgi:hypothetical protein